MLINTRFQEAQRIVREVKREMSAWDPELGHVSSVALLESRLAC